MEQTGIPNRSKDNPGESDCHATDLELPLPSALPVIVNHFDQIHDYDAEIPEHLRLHYLEKKVRLTRQWITKYAHQPIESILDIGCGTGWHLDALGESGQRLVGLDSSARQLSKLSERKNSIEAVLGFAENLPFANESFDVVFSINTLHHLPDVRTQKRAFQEIQRVLRTGGVFIIHEISVLNPVIRFYMNHIFPKLRKIDTGEEIWLTMRTLEEELGPAVDTIFYTFIPDWSPKLVLKMCRPIESLLERSPLSILGAHFSAIFRK